MSDRIRNIVIVTIVLACVVAVNVLVHSASSSVKDLSATLNRRSPVVEYITASNETAQCRDFYRYLKDQHQARFLVDIGQHTPDGDIVALIALDADYLRRIDELCPYPTPPAFDSKGELVGDSPKGPPPPTTIPLSTTTTTLPGG